MKLDAGIYKGIATLWMEPGSPAQTGDFTFMVEPAADGHATLIRYAGKHGDSDSVGVALLSTNKRTNQLQMTWQDSFHMADEPMALIGATPQALVGTWYWDGKPFQWRIAVSQPAADRLEWRMFVIMPDGESPAVEALLTRA